MAFRACLFGAHVLHGADERRTGIEVLAAEGESEIDDKGVAGGVEQEVGGLDVAMHEPMAVGRVERLGSLGRDVHNLAARQPALLQACPQVHPFDEAHHQVVLPFVRAADVMHRQDAGMFEAGQDARFVEKGIDGRVGGEEVAVHDLDGDAPPQFDVVAEIDRAAAARRDVAQDVIAADGGGQVRRRHENRGISRREWKHTIVPAHRGCLNRGSTRRNTAILLACSLRNRQDTEPSLHSD